MLQTKKSNAADSDTPVDEETLFAVINRALTIDTVPSNNKDSKKQPEFVISATELLNMDVMEIPHLWGKFIPAEGLTALAGTSDMGKSAFLRQLAIAVALRQEEFLGAELKVKHGKAIFVSTEDNKVNTSALLKKQLKDTNIKHADVANLNFILESEDPFKKLETILKSQKTDLVVIDAFTDIFEGRINEAGSVRTFLNKYSELANTYHCAIIFLHHIGKRTEDQVPSKNNLLGSQGFEGKMRLVMELKKGNKDGSRELHFLKGNYLDDEAKKSALQLSFNNNLQFAYESTIEKKKGDSKTYKTMKELAIEKMKDLVSTGLSKSEAYRVLKNENTDLPAGRTTMIKLYNEHEAKNSTTNSDNKT